MLHCNDHEISAEAIREFTCFVPQCADFEIKAARGETFSVKTQGSNAEIVYASVSEFFRALSLLPENGKDIQITEKKRADRVTFMLDCSRGGVINENTFKKLVKILVSLGYNALMLYTEDTYEVPGEPYFGHLRGRIGIDEWKRMDAYAASFGIQLIPCIQALAHLENIFLWDHYEQIRDTQDILLIDEDRTYELIDRMFAALARSFVSRTVHIGFDEAHNIGLGKYFERHGATDRTKLLLKHLKRVLAIAEKYGFTCMMWSDMFFRLAYGGEYYPEESAPLLPSSVTELIPKNLTLIYWDYYHTEIKTYRKMIERHKAIGNPVTFGSGAWRWLGFAPMNEYGLRRLCPGASAAIEGGIRDVMLTVWGDNGNECGLFSVLPQITAFGEIFRGHEPEKNYLSRRMKEVCGASFEDFMKLDLPNAFNNEDLRALSNPSKYLFYNDPMYGLCDYHASEEICAHFAYAAKEIAKAAGKKGEFSYLFKTLAALCRFLAKKANMGNRLRALYAAKDKTALKDYAQRDIRSSIRLLDSFEEAFRKQWRIEWKSFGLDNLQLRFGGLRMRLRETYRRVMDYVNGKIERIEELEQSVLPYRYEGETDLIYKHNYQYIATPSFQILM